MYKEIITCIIIIILVLTLDLVTKNITIYSVEYINERLSDFKKELLEDNKSLNYTKEKMNNIIDEWRKKYNSLAFFIEHDELEKVETELTSLSSKIEVEEYDDGIENLNRCIFILNHIKDKYVLNIKNIF